MELKLISSVEHPGEYNNSVDLSGDLKGLSRAAKIGQYGDYESNSSGSTVSKFMSWSALNGATQNEGRTLTAIYSK